MSLVGTVRIMGFGNPLFVTNGLNGWSLGVLAPFDSVNGAAVTPAELQIPVGIGQRVTVTVRGVGISADNTFEFEARNSWRRPAVGNTVRLGTTSGVGDSVVNDFGGPKPSLSFSASTPTHIASPIFTGKTGVTVTFHVVYEIRRSPWVV